MWQALAALGGSALQGSKASSSEATSGPTSIGGPSISYSKPFVDLSSPVAVLGLVAVVLAGVIAWRKLAK